MKAIYYQLYLIVYFEFGKNKVDIIFKKLFFGAIFSLPLPPKKRALA